MIIGLGAPYQRDRARVRREFDEYPLVPETDRRDEVLALSYPREEDLLGEYASYVGVLERYGVEVLRADPGAAYSFDYTCPRDIGFVVRDQFYIANMAVQSRAQEIETIQHHLEDVDPARVHRPPAGALLEGGDVVWLAPDTLLVGINRRSNAAGAHFLKQRLATDGIEVLAVKHRCLHLDCCLNPLGGGELLIHPASLSGNEPQLWERLEQHLWLEVDGVEREHLVTNVLSIAPSTVLARDHPACTRVNDLLRARGYQVEAIQFDGVPATGGSFRCASLPLLRR
ncbi:MAG: arginine deiminase family protein [Pseudomonadota bacterium]